MITHLRNQSIPPKHKWIVDYQRLFILASELPITTDGVGDCLSVDFNPEGMRKFGYARGKLFHIRQMSRTTWYVWRVK